MSDEKKLWSIIDKACYDYELIQPGDKILIGASGGKDSTALIQYFANRSKRPDSNFEFKAINIQTDFASPFPPVIKELFDQWNVPFETLQVNVLERLKENKKMNCYWCSSQRRNELLNYAVTNGYNKIALGHHLDDILETFIMNMTEKGNVATMIPKLQYDKWPVTIIRPLCYVCESRLIEHAQNSKYSGFTCTCNFQDNSTRKLARKKLTVLSDDDEKTKIRIFTALKNIKSEYLP